jgi:hypothetical protein
MKTILFVVLTLVLTVPLESRAEDDYGDRDSSSVSVTQDPVAQFPDQAVLLVDEQGNWLSPPAPPAVEPGPELETINTYVGVGN